MVWFIIIIITGFLTPYAASYLNLIGLEQGGKCTPLFYHLSFARTVIRPTSKWLVGAKGRLKLKPQPVKVRKDLMEPDFIVCSVGLFRELYAFF